MGFWLRRSCAAIFLTLSLAACAASTGQQGGAGSSSGSPASGAAASADDEGASIEQAVVLSDAHNEMDGIGAEHKWTASHYPGWGWDAQSLLNQGGRVYDLIEISRGGEHRKVYFDITDWFGRLE